MIGHADRGGHDGRAVGNRVKLRLRFFFFMLSGTKNTKNAKAAFFEEKDA